MVSSHLFIYRASERRRPERNTHKNHHNICACFAGIVVCWLHRGIKSATGGIPTDTTQFIQRTSFLAYSNNAGRFSPHWIITRRARSTTRLAQEFEPFPRASKGRLPPSLLLVRTKTAMVIRLMVTRRPIIPSHIHMVLVPVLTVTTTTLQMTSWQLMWRRAPPSAISQGRRPILRLEAITTASPRRWVGQGECKRNELKLNYHLNNTKVTGIFCRQNAIILRACMYFTNLLSPYCT